MATALRRTLWSRCRTLRWTDLVSWLVIVIAMTDLVEPPVSAWTVAAGLLGVGYRALVVTEWVRVDSTGISWRTVVATRHVPWEEIASVEITTRPVATFLRRSTLPVSSLEVVRADGGTPWRPRPSEWTSLDHLTEFVAAARLISPHDWWTPAPDGRRRLDEVGRAITGRRSGKRVGRPIPRRRQRGA